MVTAFQTKLIILLWLLICISPALPAAQGVAAQDQELFDQADALRVRIVRIEDDGSIVTDTGEELVLAGLDQAYRLVPANRYYLTLLRRLSEENPVWSVPAARRDRYGRPTGQVIAGDGVWVQDYLVRRGAARFAGGVTDPQHRRALLETEVVARRSAQGLWGSGHWSISKADDPSAIGRGFEIVTGTVIRVARVGKIYFLNFGDDWRSDFSLGSTLRSVPGTDAGAPTPLHALEGRRVRVRGIVRSYNGPYMDLVAPDQIEILDDPAD